VNVCIVVAGVALLFYLLIVREGVSEKKVVYLVV